MSWQVSAEALEFSFGSPRKARLLFYCDDGGARGPACDEGAMLEHVRRALEQAPDWKRWRGLRDHLRRLEAEQRRVADALEEVAARRKAALADPGPELGSQLGDLSVEAGRLRAGLAELTPLVESGRRDLEGAARRVGYLLPRLAEKAFDELGPRHRRIDDILADLGAGADLLLDELLHARSAVTGRQGEVDRLAGRAAGLMEEG